MTTTKSNGIARVTFRVRCETLGYGEHVYLHHDGNVGQVRISVYRYIYSTESKVFEVTNAK